MKDTAYVPSMRRNLISIFVLDGCGYSFHFGDGRVYVYYDSGLVGYGILSNGLYMLNVNSFSVDQRESDVNSVVGKKRGRIVESSSMLWHKRLGHISRERMERLIKENILHDLDFSDFETCIDCVKGKLTAGARKDKANRSEGILQLIQTDICGPITPVALGGFRYFITFINDFSIDE